MPFTVIAAATMVGGIGYHNDLPWRIPADMRRFKRLTSCVKSEEKFNAIIMGRKTWQSLPTKPLPDRINIVLTRDKSFSTENAFVVHSFDEALETASSLAETTFVIGGAELYSMALQHPECKRIHLTRVVCHMGSGVEPVADVFVPELSPEWLVDNNFVSSDMRGYLKTAQGLQYYFLTFDKSPSNFSQE